MVNSKYSIVNDSAANIKHYCPGIIKNNTLAENVTVNGSKLKIPPKTGKFLVTERPQTKCVERPTKGKKMKTVWRVDLCLTPHYRDTGLSRVSSATSGQPRVVTPA